MSKGLDALEKIKQAEYFVDFEQDAKIKDDYKAELTIIETALKRLETLEEEKQSFDRATEKKLKDYEQLKEDYKILKESYDAQCFNKDTIDNLRSLCDKLQKVLGIIKSKYVDLWLLSHFKSWNAYQNAHMNCSKIPLTKEEYETICRWFYDKR